MPATLPVDIVNRALDECGVEPLGDLEDGSRTALAATRIYFPTVRQLLAAAQWNFARKDEAMVMIGDRNGVYNPNTDVAAPWGFMYEWPTDCVHARWVPRTYANSEAPGIPIFSSGNATTYQPGWTQPTPFIVTSKNKPNPISSDWYLIEGHDPEQTKVILTNQINARLIYTGLMMYPDAWDPLFEQAVVAVLAARLAMPTIVDRKEARVVRADNIAIAKAAIDMARVRDGDEGWTVQNHTPDWMQARTSYGGVLYYGWCGMSFGADAGGVY